MTGGDLRFGVLTLPHVSWPRLAERWQAIEELGFDSVWACDHFVNPYAPAAPWFEGWTLLAALATQTHGIRLGNLVTTITYRNPAVLAREALTVDHISGGRLELAIGAGGAPLDASMTGVDEWPGLARARRFREFVAIVDTLLREPTTTYAGHYYHVAAAQMQPAPVQRPRPPLTLAAESPSSLRLVAERADRWVTYGLHARSGVADPRQLADYLRTRNAQLDELCLARGRDPRAIARCLLTGLTREELFGSLAAFEDYVGRYREAGVNEFVLYWLPTERASDDGFVTTHLTRMADDAMLARVAHEVLPRLRGGG